MIFITGGTGMVGAHLLYDLTQKGEKVRALKRPGSPVKKTEKIFSFYTPSPEKLLSQIEWVEGDILDKEGLSELLNGVTQIYHCAAIVSFDSSKRDEIIQINGEGTANLVDLALTLGISKFCHVSSIAAIGSPPDGSEANEEHPWRTSKENSAYAESKYNAEMEVWRGTLEGLDAVIVNPSVIIGPGDWKTGSSTLFSTIWKGMKFYTSGGTGFVDVKDVVTAMQLLMTEGNWVSVKNQRYILNAENLLYRECFNLVADNLKVNRPKIRATKALLTIGYRISAIKKFFTGIPAALTREIAKNANKVSLYNGTKISKALNFNYISVADSIQQNSKIFLAEHRRKD